MGSTRSRWAMAVAGLTLGASLVATAPLPVAADPADSDTLVFVPFRGQTFGVVRNGTTTTPSYTTGDFRGAEPFEGDFTSEEGTDVFWYRPGAGPDGIVNVVPTGTTATTSFIPKTVNGFFQPLVGDFDGNAIDDILWYAPGSAGDALWLFDGGGGHTNVPLAINGDYVPTVLEANGDDVDDILFYKAGTGADSMWLFGAGGTHTTKAITINGGYRLIPGIFADSPQERLVFFNAAGADSIWSFDSSANHTSAPLPNIDGAFIPIVGGFIANQGEAIFWYRPGSGSEAFWSFNADGGLNQLDAPSINGTYESAVGDFDGNGYQDIAWTSGGNATIWRFHSGGFGQSYVNTGLPNTTALTAFASGHHLG